MHVCQFVLDNIDYQLDCPYVCKVNRYVCSNLISNAGFIKNYQVPIGGTCWKPELPIKSKIREEINDIVQIENPTGRAITMMPALMISQMFGGGNKRDGMIAANQIMIFNGIGVISIPIELQREFSNFLVK